MNEVARISGKHCCCVEDTKRDFKLRKISEGKYLINGRTVFVRVSLPPVVSQPFYSFSFSGRSYLPWNINVFQLLKGVHVMVRIGGGWETLEEFLVRNDPCRGKRNGGLQRRASFGVGAYRRPASSPAVVHNHRSLCSTPSRSRHSSRNSLFNWSHVCTIPFLRCLIFSWILIFFSIFHRSRCAIATVVCFVAGEVFFVALTRVNCTVKISNGSLLQLAVYETGPKIWSLEYRRRIVFAKWMIDFILSVSAWLSISSKK